MHPNVRRAIVRGYYKGPRWRARVMAMTDEEVERMYIAKQYHDEDKLQNSLKKAENDEVHPYGAQS